ncbi:HipA domain-containing protein [Rathayibacter sp. VKM Ac-2856]|uniref:type II toxin-antitoxin system HipA family toxin n=1 Tax=unclassified Rathayibacter TaxID=2609250 RepID=UPI00132EE047|nr:MULTISPECIES: HipA domain-containing protein [unclassified Rathayibacter]NQX04998.1 HipA domain-containing protein [Rathayibacter sp. VKM Ac-2858]NQX20166.1 HipA domain-containing protein [Rathayibacter sp. VKM Ac-2856]QHF25643.1 hypothetical protein GTU73_17685 [Rathayibacter sp. VKM Ac-2804]
MPELDLFLHDRRVGSVSPADGGRRVDLRIARDYDEEVVLTESFATIRGRTPASLRVSDFLGGYVPEGSHRERMAAKRRIDKDDLFALLTEFGGSVAGAVTLRRPDENPLQSPSYERLDDASLSARLTQALKDSDQGIPADSRSTLPGFQPKVLVARIEGAWAAPHGRAHSTHILKPQIPSRPHRIHDEHYSHLLAQHLGLATFESSLHTAAMTTYLAIERFDREIHDGEVLLHHQEDLAQALGLDWRDSAVKFQDPAWPNDPRRASAARIAELLGSIPEGAAAVRDWIRRLAYTVAIGDNDAHAKNVAILHLPEGSRLAPIYDALPNLFQDGLISWDLALAVDGQFDHRRISMERILAEITSWRVIGERQADLLVRETIGRLREALDAVPAPSGCSPGLLERLRWNADRLLDDKEISAPKKRK